MNFFFCWANHSWYRSWEGSKELLIEQNYGGAKEWEKHFKYLLPFFKDERYEKKNNKPIIMLFNSLPNSASGMLELWDRLAVNNGFSGIEVLFKLDKYNDRMFKNRSSYYREPGTATNSFIHNPKNILARINLKTRRVLSDKGYKTIPIFDGNKLYREMVMHYNRECIPGLFFEWDNTSRHGYRGYVITPPSKEMFLEYMNTIKYSRYVFINAWNEWCEGMIMEPSEENGYKYLEWIKEWKLNNMI